MKKLFSRFFNATFIRFLIVGVINTLVGTAVMFALYNLAKCGYWFSSAMNYVVGSVVSYFLNKRFTFRQRSADWKTMLRFAVNIVVCYLVAYRAARPLARLALSGASETVRDNVAMLFGMVIFVLLNYFGQRFFVFRAHKKAETTDEADAPEKADTTDESNDPPA